MVQETTEDTAHDMLWWSGGSCSSCLPLFLRSLHTQDPPKDGLMPRYKHWSASIMST